MPLQILVLKLVKPLSGLLARFKQLVINVVRDLSHFCTLVILQLTDQTMQLSVNLSFAVNERLDCKQGLRELHPDIDNLICH